MNETIFISLPKSELQDIIIDCVNACLKHSSTPIAKQQESDPWLDLEALCKYDPEKRAKPTIYSLVSRNEIPHYKRGKKLYFLKSEIDHWLKAGKRKTSTELQVEADNYLLNRKKSKGLQ